MIQGLDDPSFLLYLHPMHGLMKDLPQLILASESPRRAELLRQLGVKFQVAHSKAAESAHEHLTAREVAQLNAYRKARSVAKKMPDALVLGADTVVALGTTLFGKPATLEDAYRMLEQLQGKVHIVATAVCLLCLRQHRQRIFVDTTAVKFRPLDAVGIRRYLTRVNPLDKAGAYAIQEQGDSIIEKIDGSYTNVVGLPTELLEHELNAWVDQSRKLPSAPLLAVLGKEARLQPRAQL